MLKKNIYLIYPAGYHGNYVKWAIESSDAENQAVIQNPINTNANTQFGGIGTSHHHARIPTHQSMCQHNWWIIYNRPQDYKVYLINSGMGAADISNDVANLLIQDPTGIVINLHDNDDPDLAAFGRINCVTKWPTYLAVMFDWYFEAPKNLDVFDCSTNREFRNFVLKHNFLGSCGKPHRDQIIMHIQRYAAWFGVRNRYQPHEVNFDTYPPIPTLHDRFFDFSIDKILSPEFPDLIENLLPKLGVVDNVDCASLKQYHSDYVKIQPNIPWFESIENWRRTGELDTYLLSHSIIQAEILRFIFIDSGIRWPSQHEKQFWLTSYAMIRDPSWPDIRDPLEFYDLETDIQKEIEHTHGVKPLYGPCLRKDMMALDWENCSLEYINERYQRNR